MMILRTSVSAGAINDQVRSRKPFVVRPGICEVMLVPQKCLLGWCAVTPLDQVLQRMRSRDED